MPMSADDILFEKGGVFVHTSVSASGTGAADADVLISGNLRLLQTSEGRFLEWKPEENAVTVKHKNKVDHGWAVIDSVSYKNGVNESADISISPPNSHTHMEQTAIQNQHRHNIHFNLEDLKSIKKSNRSFGWPYLIFIMKDGTTLPALHFHNGGCGSMLQQLKAYLHIKQSASDSRLYLVHENDPNALHRSFDELNLFDTTAPALVAKFMRDPYSATLGGFSKVTNFFRDSLIQETQSRSQEDFARMLDTTPALPGLETNDQEEPGYELITCAELPPRPTVKRGQPLSIPQWTKHMDKEGVVINITELKETIFKGGMDPSIRIEVWKFLLNYYKWDSTYKERMDLRKMRVDDYFRMKLQWKSIYPEQAKRFSPHRERECLIEKDVNRTDRTHDFYQGDNNPNLVLLNDILMTYCMYNFDLGYVQGMSDLLSPILYVMENEVDAFWCFCGFMEMVHMNFEMNQEGMKKQLTQLHTLVQFVDTELCNHLESHDSSNMYFCFRWLLIVFKREFVFTDVLRLWEVYWTGKPCQNFHLLICLAILDTEKAVLIENNFGFNEILKHINDICFQIDLEDVLRKAEAIYRQFCDCRNLPKPVCEIVGLPYQLTSVVDQEPRLQATTNNHGLEPSTTRQPCSRPPKTTRHHQTRAMEHADFDSVPDVDASTMNPMW